MAMRCMHSGQYNVLISGISVICFKKHMSGLRGHLRGKCAGPVGTDWPCQKIVSWPKLKVANQIALNLRYFQLIII